MLRLDLRRSCCLESEGARVDGTESEVVDLELATARRDVGLGFLDGLSVGSLGGRPRFRVALVVAGFWAIFFSFPSSCVTMSVPTPDSRSAAVALLFERVGLSLGLVSLVLLRFFEAITRYEREQCGYDCMDCP